MIEESQRGELTAKSQHRREPTESGGELEEPEEPEESQQSAIWSCG